jgi:hypothetical protein
MASAPAELFAPREEGEGSAGTANLVRQFLNRMRNLSYQLTCHRTRVAVRCHGAGRAPVCRSRRLWFTILLVTVLLRADVQAEPIKVLHPQGSAHGFVVLKTLEGTRIATGDMTQTVHGDRVTSRLVFRFRDGSVDDDVTVFSQRGVFRLISDHHIQRGPTFPVPSDVLINAVTGQITSRTKDGKVRQDHLDLPADVSNGLPPNLLMNIPPTIAETKLSFVAPTEKPRLIQVSIKPAREVAFRIGDTKRKATDFLLHPELGGVTGMIAPIIGKQPADYHIWILQGSSPAFIREEGQLYQGGPIWRIEQISPTFPK